MNAANNEPPLAGERDPSYPSNMDRRLTILETRFDTILPTLATRADVDALRAEIRMAVERMRSEFRTGNGAMRGELQVEDEKTRTELRVEIERSRGEFGTELEKMRGTMEAGFLKLHAELATLRSEFFRSLSDMTKWFIGIIVTLVIGLAGMNIAMFNALDRMEASQAALQARAAGTGNTQGEIVQGEDSPARP
jgi:hypothetical protein